MARAVPRSTARRRTGARPRARRRRHPTVALGAWRRRVLARVPVGGLLALASMGLAAAALRAGPPAADPGAGPTAAVVVATATLDVGAVVAAGDVEVRDLPADAVAPGAATDAAEVEGRAVVAPIAAGEPVLEARLAPTGLRGIAAWTPPGWSAFAVPVDAATPPVEVGQQVDLFAPTAGAVALDGPAERVAAGGVVVAVDDRRVTVAVGPDDGPAVAAALAGTTVVLAVAGPPPAGAPP